MKSKLTTRSVEASKPKPLAYDLYDTEIVGFLLRVNPTGLKTYYFTYRNSKEKRTRYKIGRATEITSAQARNIAKKLTGEVADGKDPQIEKTTQREQTKKRQQRLLRVFLDQQYGPWVIANRKTGADTLARIHAHFSDSLDKELEQISAWNIEKWRSNRFKAGIKPSTVNRDMACLKAVLQKAVEWNVIEVNPLSKLKPSKIDKLPKSRYLTKQEEQRLKQALSKRDTSLKAKRNSGNLWRETRGYNLYPIHKDIDYVDYLEPIIILAMNTGLRKGEILSLEWRDINFPTKHLTVRGTNTKNSNTRHIPLNTVALKMLKQWKSQDKFNKYIFHAGDGIKLANFKKSYRNLLKQARIENFTIHDLRHHFASKLVMSGVPLNTVRELLGHANLDTTIRYAHLAPDHKAEAVELINS